MDLRRLLCFISYGLIFLASVVGAKKSLRENIYYYLNSFSYCVRLLNATHEIGCQSSASGNVGVLHLVRQSADVDYILKSGPHPPYIPVIQISIQQFINVPTLKSFENSGRVSGIVLTGNLNDSIESFSPDSSCPNDGSGLYPQEHGTSCNEVQWNSVGNSLMLQKWDIPIFFVYGNDARSLLNECIFRFNQQENVTVPTYPLCAAQLKSPMDAAVNSEVCIRRSSLVTNLNPQSRCDPLGDFNVWSTLNPVDSRDGPLGPKSTIVLAARMDSAGMFNHFRPGTQTSISGLITLLLVSEILALVRTDLLDKHILIIFFNGEAFDYIGSSRVVYEMQAGRFPRQLHEEDNGTAQTALFNVDNIDFFIELSQLGDLENSTMFLHSDWTTKSPVVRRKVTAFSQLIAAEANRFQARADFLNFSQPLPPSSFQQFLKTGTEIPGIVIADHKKEYRNKFYNSLLDLIPSEGGYPANMSDADKYEYPIKFAVNAAQVATVVARSVYKYVTNKNLDREANLNKSANLFYCFSYHSLCPLFSSFFDENTLPEKYLSNTFLDMYTGVNRNPNPLIPALMIWNVLSVAVGEPTNLTESECLNKPTNQLYRYNFVAETVNGTRNGTCWKSPSGVSEARSPAFIENDFSSKYSTWTESVWGSDVSIRIFLQANPQEDLNTLALGIVLTIVSTIVIYAFERSANYIFLVSRD